MMRVEAATIIWLKEETIEQMMLLSFYFESFMMWMETATIVWLKEEKNNKSNDAAVIIFFT